jgi:lipopolysaccharide transport system permease protein
LLFQLVRRDFQQRFVGSAAGWVWAVIHPLVLLLSWTFVFSVCLKTPLPPGQPGNYPLFLFAGMLPWLLFSESVTRSASSMVEQSNLITKTVFPAEMLPVAVFLSTLIGHLLAVLLAIAGALIFLAHISVSILFLPLMMMLLALFSIGIGWIVSSFQVYLRDTVQVLTVVLTFWFWVTPVFLSERRYPPRWRFLLALNPLSYPVHAYRQALLGSFHPRLSELLLSAALCGTVFLIGAMCFRYLKRGFADVL